jgi:UPF0716 protein FxsA
VVPLVVAAWAVLEIWLMTVVAGATSALTVLLLVLAGLVFGAAAVKRAGRSAWRNLAASVQQPGAPVAPPAGGGRTGLAMLGGLLLIIPGFVSDAMALFLLFPPTRSLIGSLTEKATARALAKHPAPDPGSLGDLLQQAREAEARSRIHRPDGKVIQGEVVDRDQP